MNVSGVLFWVFFFSHILYLEGLLHVNNTAYESTNIVPLKTINIFQSTAFEHGQFQSYVEILHLIPPSLEVF